MSYIELSADLDALRAANLYRRARRMESPPGPKMLVDGRDVLVFGSNNYLGLAMHPALRRAAAEAAEVWGVGSTGSRLTTGNFALHEDLEHEIAEFKGCEAALVFGSGYATAIGVISALVSHGDLILSDTLNHASLIDGCRLSRAETRIYRHCDPDHVKELLADRARFRRCLVVTDGVFSMDGDVAPLREITDLCQRHDAWLMVDDAHGTGVLGANGTGTLEHLGIEKENVIQMGTLGKALGSEGGFIAGSEVLIDYLRNRARTFIFSTAPAPPAIAAARAALKIVKSEPERRVRLRENVNRLRGLLGPLRPQFWGNRTSSLDPPILGEGVTPIVPVILGSSQAALDFAEKLLENGVYAPAIRPPTVPEGTARLRMSVTSEHDITDIEQTVKIMAEIANGDYRDS